MIDRVAITVMAIAGGALAAVPVCAPCAAEARFLASAVAASPAADTATVRLHISGMTCGSCATTARLALRRLNGVYSAEVSADDSLGVVRYDPARLTTTQIVAHLERMTAYRARVLPDTSRIRGTRK